MASKIIELKQVNYKYQVNTPLESTALKDISFAVDCNDYLAIVGHTGSGKSTLIQMFNGLLLPMTGEIKVLGYTLNSQTSNDTLYQLRKSIGIVFQFAESQLFAETVLEDVCFGPQNFGLSKEEAQEKAIWALSQVGIGKELYHKSPFELSGGQKRRVAIAGVIAMNPKILILDEPTIGLDPKGRVEIMELINNLHKQGTTIILVTHSMDDVFNYTNNVVVLDNGRLVKYEKTDTIFKDENWLFKHHLELPKLVKFKNDLQSMNLINTNTKIDSIETLAKELASDIIKGGDN